MHVCKTGSAGMVLDRRVGWSCARWEFWRDCQDFVGFVRRRYFTRSLEKEHNIMEKEFSVLSGLSTFHDMPSLKP